MNENKEGLQQGYTPECKGKIRVCLKTSKGFSTFLYNQKNMYIYLNTRTGSER